MIPVQSHWRVPPDLHGLRADQFLQRKVGRISRARAQHVIKNKDFLLDGFVVKVSQRVKYGQKATLIRLAPDMPSDIAHISNPIVFENEHFLIVNKIAGLSMHPSANCLFKTLTYWLRVNRPNDKINPCHRIDKETSGLVICAKDRMSERELKKLFMQNRISKSYVAIIRGRLKAQIITIPLMLQRDRGLVAIRMIADNKGKTAQTRVRPLFYDQARDRSLIMCRPKTGRQHQIRAHLAEIGHPIVGDKLYAHGEEFFDRYCRRCPDIELELEHHRHALHAWGLSFIFKNQRFAFSCPLPEDFARLI